MSVNSGIEWTMHTWNPTTGCDKVSAGCRGCYAEVMHRRLMKMHPRKYNKPFLGNVVTHPEDLNFPMTIKKPSVIFVDSMSDLFHKDVPFEFILEVFEVMAGASQHTFQVLTKRPERAVEFFRWVERKQLYKWPLKNVWIGTSVEDQKTANERIPHLVKIPTVVRFLSCEPLLGAIDIGRATGAGNPVEQKQKYGKNPTGFSWFVDNGINWVIAGGESGHNSRPAHPDWVRSLRDQCKAAGVPFFFKQWGQWGPTERAIDLLKPDQALNVFQSTHIYKDGKLDKNPPHTDIDNEECEWMFKLGKHQSGSELDRQVYKEMPKTEWFKG